MEFRSDREALRQRVDDLEDEVEARDAEVVRLRAELEQARSPEPTPEPERGPKLSLRLSSQPADPMPNGDRWQLPMREPQPMVTLVYVIWALTFSVLTGRGLLRGDLRASVPFLIFVPLPILMLLYRSGVVLDRRAGTFTTYKRLIVRWERTFPLDGRMLHIERTLVTSKNSDSYWAGRIHLGDQLLVIRKEKEAEALAQSIAEFAGVRLV